MFFFYNKSKGKPTGPEDFSRVRIPRQGDILGLVVGMQGGARMLVECQDGKTRLCRVPGAIKRRIWVREGDYVIVEPWSVEGDTKGDIAYRYTASQFDYLKRKGYVKV